MASKKRALDDVKKRIKGKLNDITEQFEILHQLISSVKDEAVAAGEELLQLNSKTKLLQNFPAVSQKLDGSLSHLLLIKNAIYSLDGGQSGSGGESEDEDSNDESQSEPSTCLPPTVVDDSEKVVSKISDKGDLQKLKNDSADEKPQSTLVLESQKDEKERQKYFKASEGLKNLNLKEEISVNYAPLDESKSPGQLSKKAPMSLLPALPPPFQRIISDDVKVAPPVIYYDTALTLLVTESTNPWDFYVQVFGDLYDHLMEELCLYFSRQASQGYRGGSVNIPAAGCYCCAKSPVNGTWYRARVVEVKSIDTAESTVAAEYCSSESVASCYEDPVLKHFKATVFLIDEGVTNDVPLTNLRPLDPEFSHLPAQAIHCMLAGVGPSPQDEACVGNSVTNAWSSESIDWFKTTIFSENFFTGFIHHSSVYHDCLPIDLYIGEQAGNPPPIDDSVGCMMLMVNMATPFFSTPSHLKPHYQKIDRISYKPLSDNDFTEQEEPRKPSCDVDRKESESKKPVISNPALADKATPAVESLALDVEKISLSETAALRMSVDEKPKRESGSTDKLRLTPAMSGTFENRFKEKTFDVGKEGFCPIVVSNVKDPSLFFVYLMTPDIALFDSMTEKLNTVYSNTEFTVPKEHLNIGNAVVVRFSEDRRWCRGVIQHLRIPDRGVGFSRDKTSSSASDFEYEILHVDFGSFEWVKHADVRPVVEEFFELPMETVPCCMADIEPMEISRDVSNSTSSSSSSKSNDRKRTFSREMKSNIKPKPKESSPGEPKELAAGEEVFCDDGNEPLSPRVRWSKDAVKRFMELTLDGQLRIASLKDNTNKQRLPDDPWAVCLYNTNADPDVFINQVLVDEGLAVSNVFTKATEEKVFKKAIRRVVVTEQELDTALKEKQEEVQSPQSPTSPTSLMMSQWNPMADAYHSYRNAYTVDIDDPSVAATGNVEPVRNICRAYLSRTGCRRGASCYFEHARPGDPSRVKHEAFCVTVTEEQLQRLLPDFGEFVLVKVTVMITPLMFYVRFPFGPQPFGDILKASSFTQQCNEIDELLELQEKMNKMFASMPYRKSDLAIFLEGELVATKYSKDGQWYRARVIQVMERREYEVFYIDYGNVEVVQEKNIRKLVPELLFLDPQAIEVSLSGVEMKESINGMGFTKEETMQRLKEMLGDGVAIARVMSRSINGTLKIELFDKKSSVNIGKEMTQLGYFQPLQQRKTLNPTIQIKVGTALPRLIPG